MHPEVINTRGENKRIMIGSAKITRKTGEKPRLVSDWDADVRGKTDQSTLMDP